MWLKKVLSILLGFIIIRSLSATPIGFVILDAGHGGYDPGAIALRDGTELLEKDIVLDLTLRVATYVRMHKQDLEVLLTREDDRYVSLEERANRAAQLNPGVGKSAVFISIHANSSTASQASGFEVLIKKTQQWVRFLDTNVKDWEIARYANFTASDLNKSLNRENLLFAAAVSKEIAKALPGMRNRGIKEQDVWVLHATKVPTILVEVGFLSNTEDASRMTQESWLTTISAAIGDGILHYINSD